MEKLRVTKIESQSKKILKDRIRIVYLSDIHVNKKFDYTKMKLINIFIQNLNPKPDIILMGGDLVDDTKLDKEEFANTIDFVKNLSKNQPLIIGTGNHDQMTKNPDANLIDRLNPKSEKRAWLPFINQKWVHELSNVPNTYVLQSIPSHTVHFEQLGIGVGEIFCHIVIMKKNGNLLCHS